MLHNFQLRKYGNVARSLQKNILSDTFEKTHINLVNQSYFDQIITDISSLNKFRQNSG